MTILVDTCRSSALYTKFEIDDRPCGMQWETRPTAASLDYNINLSVTGDFWHIGASKHCQTLILACFGCDQQYYTFFFLASRNPDTINNFTYVF